MISVNDIQAAFIYSLKADALITGTLGNYDIREDEWQGKEFVYPNLRVDVGDLIPQLTEPCDQIKVAVNIIVFTESDSSASANYLASLIADKYHRHNFKYGLRKYSTVSTRIGAAKRINERTWKAVVSFMSDVN